MLLVLIKEQVFTYSKLCFLKKSNCFVGLSSKRLASSQFFIRLFSLFIKLLLLEDFEPSLTERSLLTFCFHLYFN
jgi:hypothetical protein